MQEKTIIQGERYKINIKGILIAIATGLILLGLIIYACGEGYSSYWEEWYSIGDVMFDPFSFTSGLLIDFGVILLPFVLILYWWLSSVEISVTSTRIYGKAAFGKRVDLPLDKISAVGTSFLKGIDVGTSSGRIKFKLVKNQDEIHSTISQLLMEHQQAEKANSTQNNEKSSNADELKKYKDLLDSGIITQEEFEQKKKQLLGL